MAKGRIPESDIEEIRNQVRIEDVVGEYVPTMATITASPRVKAVTFSASS